RGQQVVGRAIRAHAAQGDGDEFRAGRLQAGRHGGRRAELARAEKEARLEADAGDQKRRGIHVDARGSREGAAAAASRKAWTFSWTRPSRKRAELTATPAAPSARTAGRSPGCTPPITHAGRSPRWAMTCRTPVR